MASIVVRIALQLSVAVAALLGLNYSLLNWLTGSHASATELVTLPVLGFDVTRPKQEIELLLRFAIVVVAFLGLFVYEAVAYWQPKQDLLKTLGAVAGVETF
jgi:hypothetical protein